MKRKKPTAVFERDQLEEAQRSIRSTLGKCKKVKPKLQKGSPQHTLLVRRIKALEIAAALIKRELRTARPE